MSKKPDLDGLDLSVLSTRSIEPYPSHGPRVARFCEQFLTLNKSFAGQPFVPLPWMRDVLNDIYRIDPETGRRKHRTYLLGVARKNAKSTLAAAIAVYMLVADNGDPEPEIISAAGDRKQAKLVFKMAADMILADPYLSKHCRVMRDEIRCNLNGGTYKAVSADAGLAQGLNPSTVIVDEYHVHKSAELFEALTLGSGMRRQPLTFVISTAGHDLESPLGVLYSYGLKVLSGEIDDPSFGMTWFGPKPGETVDPGCEETWRRCNPSFEIMNLGEFRNNFKLTRESEFIRYRLNGWTASSEAWFRSGRFEALADENLAPLVAGDECVFGFDGAWSGDCTAIVAYRLSDRSLHVLEVWEKPDGDNEWRTPKAEVRDTLRELIRQFDPKEVAADPFLFQEELQTLTDEKLPIVAFHTNQVNKMSAAAKIFQDAVLDETLTHNGDPVLCRHMANTNLKIDRAGRRLPVRDSKTNKRFIDVAIGSVIAVATGDLYRDETPSDAEAIIL